VLARVLTLVVKSSSSLIEVTVFIFQIKSNTFRYYSKHLTSRTDFFKFQSTTKQVFNPFKTKKCNEKITTHQRNHKLNAGSHTFKFEEAMPKLQAQIAKQVSGILDSKTQKA
jgi:hypothetical protein